MDFCFLGTIFGKVQYVLVLKDELTHYCELTPCDSPTSGVAAAAILDWNKRYGLPDMWVSDCGSHFMNSILQDLRQRLHLEHKFFPV